ncbi:MAG: hypothetical protein QOI55_2367, partial [Actinomycetota bacterium]|nr:hypothetical protein [Actinomycetota bacterium]
MACLPRGDLTGLLPSIANRLESIQFMRRVPLVLASLVAAASLASPAAAQDASQSSALNSYGAPVDPAHDMVFPVIGDVSYTDTFGAPRGGGRTHEGQDLLGQKMQEEVAADAGTVTTLTWPEASYGYYLRITADDGWTYTYVHINNDTPGTDDGAADRKDVYGPGIDKGTRVQRGQLVAYLGDSGDAENTQPHLHFEMRRPDGSLVNPMKSLDAAQHIDAPAGQTVDPSPIPRLAGADRVATSVAVSTRGWPNGSPVAVLAAGDSYAEALPASVLAAKSTAPLLLVTGATLPDIVAGELDRLKAATVLVVGSVPAAVDDALHTAGREVRRVGVAGDPVATSVAVGNPVGGAAGVGVLVTLDRLAEGGSAAGRAAGHG